MSVPLSAALRHTQQFPVIFSFLQPSVVTEALRSPGPLPPQVVLRSAASIFVELLHLWPFRIRSVSAFLAHSGLSPNPQLCLWGRCPVTVVEHHDECSARWHIVKFYPQQANKKKILIRFITLHQYWIHILCFVIFFFGHRLQRVSLWLGSRSSCSSNK